MEWLICGAVIEARYLCRGISSTTRPVLMAGSLWPNADHPRIQPAAAVQTGIEFDLLELLLVMAQRKLTIILATIIGLLLGTVVVFLIHPTSPRKQSSCLRGKGNRAPRW